MPDSVLELKKVLYAHDVGYKMASPNASSHSTPRDATEGGNNEANPAAAAAAEEGEHTHLFIRRYYKLPGLLFPIETLASSILTNPDKLSVLLDSETNPARSAISGTAGSDVHDREVSTTIEEALLTDIRGAASSREKSPEEVQAQLLDFIRKADRRGARGRSEASSNNSKETVKESIFSTLSPDALGAEGKEEPGEKDAMSPLDALLQEDEGAVPGREVPPPTQPSVYSPSSSGSESPSVSKKGERHHGVEIDLSSLSPTLLQAMHKYMPTPQSQLDKDREALLTTMEIYTRDDVIAEAIQEGEEGAGRAFELWAGKYRGCCGHPHSHHHHFYRTLTLSSPPPTLSSSNHPSKPRQTPSNAPHCSWSFISRV